MPLEKQDFNDLSVFDCIENFTYLHESGHITTPVPGIRRPMSHSGARALQQFITFEKTDQVLHIESEKIKAYPLTDQDTIYTGQGTIYRLIAWEEHSAGKRYQLVMRPVAVADSGIVAQWLLDESQGEVIASQTPNTGAVLTGVLAEEITVEGIGSSALALGFNQTQRIDVLGKPLEHEPGADLPKKNLVFDGATGHITCGVLGLPRADQTLIATVKTTAKSGYILSSRDNGGGGLSMFVDGLGRLQAIVGNAVSSTSVNVTDGLMHVLGLVYDHAAGTLTHYVDGVAVTVDTTVGGTWTTGQRTLIGARTTTGLSTLLNYEGKIHDVRILPVAASAIEMKEHYAYPALKLLEAELRIKGETVLDVAGGIDTIYDSSSNAHACVAMPGVSTGWEEDPAATYYANEVGYSAGTAAQGLIIPREETIHTGHKAEKIEIGSPLVLGNMPIVTLCGFLKLTGPSPAEYGRVWDFGGLTVDSTTCSLTLKQETDANGGEWEWLGWADHIDSVWFHFAIVFDRQTIGGRPVLYLNGLEQVRATVSAPSGNYRLGNGDPKIIGNSWNYGLDALGATLENFLVADRALTEPEIKAMASVRNL